MRFKACAWKVLDTVRHMSHDAARDSWRNLAEIHAAPQWLWPALVEKMTSEARLVAALGWNNVPPAELSKGHDVVTLLLTTTPSNMPGSILVPYGARFG